jgi:hypothetical protein
MVGYPYWHDTDLLQVAVREVQRFACVRVMNPLMGVHWPELHRRYQVQQQFRFPLLRWVG